MGDPLQRFAASRGSKMRVAGVNVFGTPMVEVTNEHDVPLGSLDSRLKGVVGLAQEPATPQRTIQPAFRPAVIPAPASAMHSGLRILCLCIQALFAHSY